MRKKISKVLVLSLCLILASGTLFGCENSENDGTKVTDKTASVEPIELKFGCATNKNHFYGFVMEKFKEVLEEKSGGTIKVENYYDALLGDERQLIEGCTMGTVDLALGSIPPLTGHVPETSVWVLPLLFEDDDHMLKVIKDTELSNMMQPYYEKAKLRHMGYLLSDSWRGWAFDKPIRTLADVQHSKIRSMESEVMVDAFKALGFEVAVIPFSEVPSAIQNKVVDGVDLTAYGIYNFGYAEMLDYFTPSRVFNLPTQCTMSLDTWNSLTAEQQKWVEEAMAAALEYQTEETIKINEEALVKIEELGCEVVDPVEDWDKWVEAIKPVYDKYAAEQNPEILQKIIDLRDNK